MRSLAVRLSVIAAGCLCHRSLASNGSLPPWACPSIKLVSLNALALGPFSSRQRYRPRRPSSAATRGRTSCRRPSAPAARPWWASRDGKEAVAPSACLVHRPSRSGSIDDLSVAACLASGNFPSEIFQSSPRRANAMALHGHSATRTTICAIPPARAPCRDPGTRNRGSA
jgi:hypothetical protein